MRSALLCEYIKFKRSLGPAMVVVTGVLVGLIFVYPVHQATRHLQWSIMTSGAASFWSVFILPLLVAGVCITTASCEEDADGWTIMRSAPADIRWIYFAKFTVAWIAASVATVLFMSVSVLAMYVTDLSRGGDVLLGFPDWPGLGIRTSAMLMASVGLVAVFSLAAHWFRGAVAPMILAVGAVIAAVLLRDSSWAFLV
ncbi:MAG: hypothetical protein EOP18_08280, partial [Rhizobiaceae bacterium]